VAKTPRNQNPAEITVCCCRARLIDSPTEFLSFQFLRECAVNSASRRSPGYAVFEF